MAEEMTNQKAEVWIYCKNIGEDHCGDDTVDYESVYCLPGAAAGAAADAEVELHRRAREAGWLVDAESGRVLCPQCSGQAGGGA